MIPKIIHYTWFSGDPYPPLIEHCIESWKKFLEGYEFRLWNKDSISSIENPFLQEALSKRKWAFAADFVRLYALYHHGGIYLDTDVEVYKSFNSLLSYKAFIGRENSYHTDHRRMIAHLTSHCIGAEKGNQFIKSCLEYYKGRHFILSPEEWLPDNLKFDQKTLPYIQSEIATLQGYSPSRKVSGIQIFGDDVHVFPYQYFDCHYRTKETYCRHMAMGGWRNRKSKEAHAELKNNIKRRAADMLHKVSGRLGFMLVKDDLRNFRP